MTPAEHAELSAQLARALGWPTIYIAPGGHVHVTDTGMRYPRTFDYRAPDVCLPLIEWLVVANECMVERSIVSSDVGVHSMSRGFIWAKTLPEAVARAVIALRST